MPLSKADTALRRVVSDLAQMHAEDIAAVLGGLDAPQRTAVEALLREHLTVFSGSDAAVRESFDAARLSPWLVDILRAPDAAGLTTAVHEALKASAVTLYPPQSRAGA